MTENGAKTKLEGEESAVNEFDSARLNALLSQHEESKSRGTLAMRRHMCRDPSSMSTLHSRRTELSSSLIASSSSQSRVSLAILSQAHPIHVVGNRHNPKVEMGSRTTGSGARRSPAANCNELPFQRDEYTDGENNVSEQHFKKKNSDDYRASIEESPRRKNPINLSDDSRTPFERSDASNNQLWDILTILPRNATLSNIECLVSDASTVQDSSVTSSSCGNVGDGASSQNSERETYVTTCKDISPQRQKEHSYLFQLRHLTGIKTIDFPGEDPNNRTTQTAGIEQIIDGSKNKYSLEYYLSQLDQLNACEKQRKKLSSAPFFFRVAYIYQRHRLGVSFSLLLLLCSSIWFSNVVFMDRHYNLNEAVQMIFFERLALAKTQVEDMRSWNMDFNPAMHNLTEFREYLILIRSNPFEAIDLLHIDRQVYVYNDSYSASSQGTFTRELRKDKALLTVDIDKSDVDQIDPCLVGEEHHEYLMKRSDENLNNNFFLPDVGHKNGGLQSINQVCSFSAASKSQEICRYDSFAQLMQRKTTNLADEDSTVSSTLGAIIDDISSSDNLVATWSLTCEDTFISRIENENLRQEQYDSSSTSTNVGRESAQITSTYLTETLSNQQRIDSNFFTLEKDVSKPHKKKRRAFWTTRVLVEPSELPNFPSSSQHVNLPPSSTQHDGIYRKKTRADELWSILSDVAEEEEDLPPLMEVLSDFFRAFKRNRNATDRGEIGK